MVWAYFWLIVRVGKGVVAYCKRISVVISCHLHRNIISVNNNTPSLPWSIFDGSLSSSIAIASSAAFFSTVSREAAGTCHPSFCVKRRDGRCGPVSSVGSCNLLVRLPNSLTLPSLPSWLRANDPSLQQKTEIRRWGDSKPRRSAKRG